MVKRLLQISMGSLRVLSAVHAEEHYKYKMFIRALRCLNFHDTTARNLDFMAFDWNLFVLPVLQEKRTYHVAASERDGRRKHTLIHTNFHSLKDDLKKIRNVIHTLVKLDPVHLETQFRSGGDQKYACFFPYKTIWLQGDLLVPRAFRVLSQRSLKARG